MSAATPWSASAGPRGDDVAAELSFITKVQVAAWSPGARRLAVAVINSGSQSGALILR